MGHLTKQCKIFMEHVEAKIGNSKKPLFDGTEPDRVYYSDFGDKDNSDDKVLLYEEDILEQKQVEVNEGYI